MAVASLCVPYASLERGLDACLPLIDRELYPEATYPAGQWEYMRFYEENFATATRHFAANSRNAVKALFRAGDPSGFGQVAGTALTRINGSWFGPDSYYMNHAANAEYASRATNGGRLELPVLFLAAQYDYVCETITSRLAEPMRDACSNLTEAVVASGHWMAQEQPEAVNRILLAWLRESVTEFWPD